MITSYGLEQSVTKNVIYMMLVCSSGPMGPWQKMAGVTIALSAFSDLAVNPN